MPHSSLILIALIACILFGSVFGLNVGLLSLIAAISIGQGVLGLPFDDILQGFPAGMFMTLFGATLFFSIAKLNGSLHLIVNLFVRSVGTRARLLPLAFFILAFLLSASGAGNIVATALLAPPAMALLSHVPISPSFMALMIANGANAGSLSPLAPAGIITQQQLQGMGIFNQGGRLFTGNFLANLLMALLAFVLFRGWRNPLPTHKEKTLPPKAAWGSQQALTLGLLAAVIGVSTFSKTPLALSTLIAAMVLLLFRSAEQDLSLREIPWSTLMMISGVMVLVSLLERSGGMDQLVRLALKMSDSTTIIGWMALMSGLLSVFSSSTGVVLPTMLPLIPSLVEKIANISHLDLAMAIAMGAHIVDVSPFSTLGALCLAAVHEPDIRKKMFPIMTAWGLGMAFVGALICYILFGLLELA